MGTEKNSPDSGQAEEPHEKDEREPNKEGADQAIKEEGQEKNFWERIQTLLHLHRGPDTTEELEQEIQELLEEGEGQGLIGSLEEKLINRIFEFRDTLASEIMTPSAEIVSAEEKTSVAELIRIISEEGYTRIPIYRENQDHIIGILHAKDLLRICILKPDEPMGLEGFLNPPFFVSEHKPIVDLLRDFQNRKTHMAIVTDEFGGVRGLITLEDVIEEIVGEIDDEYDEDENELRIVDEQTVIVKARIDIEDVEEYFQVELPEGPYESIGGLLIHKLGRVPRIGMVVKEGVLEFKVLAADPRRIKTIRVKRIDA
ncbi:MAG: hemolysin family protein [Desulfobulbaceae bacterium]|nr:hemolysin family protein [Desulfobulbaceae bacterium]MDY0352084.1 hemolysin family protein [Desulfobulbaceae bacterium]